MARRNYDKMYKSYEEKEEIVETPVVEEKKPTYIGTVTGGLNLNVRKQPDSNGAIVTSIKNGEQVVIVDDSNPDWYKIESPEGYVMKKFIEV